MKPFREEIKKEMEVSSEFSPHVILFMILLPFVSPAYGNRFFGSVPVSRLAPSLNCTAFKGSIKGALPLVHRAGPCAVNPVRRYNIRDALEQDITRVNSLQEIASGGSQLNETSLLGSKVMLSAKRGAGNYVVTLGFGTPKKDQTVEFDTGSFINWIQCRPCISCYPQNEPIFDPSLSSTYQRIGCNAPACAGLSARGCSGTSCVYAERYGDGSTTIGILSADTLTLNPTNVFQNFVFGCGRENRGLFEGAAGLIGLGRSQYSLNFQTASRLGNIFSYCVPRLSSGTGYLNIGQPLRPNPVYTPLVNRPGGFYYIDLIGISVAGVRLPIPLSVFRVPGTIIDSGTVITRLPPAAYVALRTAFRASMTRYTLVAGLSLLDTCYDFSGISTINYPEIRLFYSGVVITLPFEGVLFPIGQGRGCLAFAGNASPTRIGVIGNTQQKTFEVVHDNIQNRIGFAGGACS